jgi:hypothetical protein
MARLYLLCVYLVGDICVLVEPKYLRYILQIQTLSDGKFYTHIYIYQRGVLKKIADQSTQTMMTCQLITKRNSF